MFVPPRFWSFASNSGGTAAASRAVMFQYSSGTNWSISVSRIADELQGNRLYASRAQSSTYLVTGSADLVSQPAIEHAARLLGATICVVDRRGMRTVGCLEARLAIARPKSTSSFRRSTGTSPRGWRRRSARVRCEAPEARRHEHQGPPTRRKPTRCSRNLRKPTGSLAPSHEGTQEGRGSPVHHEQAAAGRKVSRSSKTMMIAAALRRGRAAG